MIRALLTALLAGAAVPAAAAATATAPAAYGDAFVAAFAEACVPQRLSYPGTQEAALTAGWKRVERTAHPELAVVIAKAESVLETDKDLDPKIEMALFERAVAGTPHHLVVSRAELTIEKGDDPWILIGCYLYNFDATAPIDPAPVTALIGKPISRSVDEDGLVGHLWGPPCPMPRTGDTYLTFISADGRMAREIGFSGLGIKFETSEPDPGEVVPETYC